MKLSMSADDDWRTALSRDAIFAREIATWHGVTLRTASPPVSHAMRSGHVSHHRRPQCRTRRRWCARGPGDYVGAG